MIDVTVVFLNDGYASLPAIACDVFRSVGRLWNTCTAQKERPPFRVTTASIDGNPTHSEGGLTLTPQKSIDRIRRTDLVFVPDAGMDPALIVERHRPLVRRLQSWHAGGAYIAAACSGVALVAEAGLLAGRRATSHWALAGELTRRYPEVDWRTDVLVTEDGGIFCGGGIYACMDLSVYLIEKLCGHDVALECAKALLVEMPRTHQAGFAVLPLATPHRDAAIRAAEEWIQRHYRSAIRIEEMATVAGLSRRTFERRFRMATGNLPLAYLQALRVAAAKRSLEVERWPIQRVSSSVGYDDVQFFRKLFKRHTGLSPAGYRERFGRAPVTIVHQR